MLGQKSVIGNRCLGFYLDKYGIQFLASYVTITCELPKSRFHITPRLDSPGGPGGPWPTQIFTMNNYIAKSNYGEM